jgi:hypothetical protein
MNASPVYMHANPGMVATHQPFARNSRPSEIIIPHSGAGGRTPSPRNPREAVVRMTSTTSEARKMTAGGTAFGRMCPRSTRQRPKPSARRAAAYSRFFSRSTSPRTSRA